MSSKTSVFQKELSNLMQDECKYVNTGCCIPYSQVAQGVGHRLGRTAGVPDRTARKLGPTKFPLPLAESRSLSGSSHQFDWTTPPPLASKRLLLIVSAICCLDGNQKESSVESSTIIIFMNKLSVLDFFSIIKFMPTLLNLLLQRSVSLSNDS